MKVLNIFVLNEKLSSINNIWKNRCFLKEQYVYLKLYINKKTFNLSVLLRIILLIILMLKFSLLCKKKNVVNYFIAEEQQYYPFNEICSRYRRIVAEEKHENELDEDPIIVLDDDINIIQEEYENVNSYDYLNLQQYNDTYVNHNDEINIPQYDDINTQEDDDIIVLQEDDIDLLSNEDMNFLEQQHTNLLNGEINNSNVQNNYNFVYDNDYNELHKLAVEYADTLNDLIPGMAYDYKNITEDMNKEWSFNMWNIKWCKYLEKMMEEVNYYLNGNFSVNDKKEYLELLLFWCKRDYDYFIDIVKKEWDKKDEPEHYLER
ncbi:exported protein (hyp11) [Plasmodium gaboni]|uniref:Exported protein (Hyp11) n=1 Tax=Plasmodium gaboni TaxID=647221 RepID=A0A151L3B5_9APIC|nr:exported protein (hyp11) [Plasmodium gaboni]KYN93440.1 exported protein (hyp11) [Plasmodium gaboni]